MMSCHVMGVMMKCLPTAVAHEAEVRVPRVAECDVSALTVANGLARRL